MRTRLNNQFCRRAGSIILEIVIVTPVFLLLVAFMLTAISCARADILFSQAVDQVTQELAVAVPVAGAGIDIAGEALTFINNASINSDKSAQVNPSVTKAGEILTGTLGGVGAVLEALGIEGGDVFGTLLFGEGIRNRIVETFYTYNSSETMLHSRIENVSVSVNYDAPNRVIWLHVYYEWNTLFGNSEKTIISAVPIFGDLELSLPETTDETAPADKVWMLSNFERGYSLRTTFAGNLPPSYPVIAKWENNTATSIKSIDLTAPGYLSPGPLSGNMQEFVDDLAGFDGTLEPWGKDNIQINSDEIAKRVLLLIIPVNSPPEVYDELLSCSEYASIHGVQIIVEKYGSSLRYSDEDNSSNSTAADNTGNNVLQ